MACVRSGVRFVGRAQVKVDYIRVLWLPAGSGRLDGEKRGAVVRDHFQWAGVEGLPW